MNIEQLPQFDYWMLTEMDSLLATEYQKRSSEGNIGESLKYVAEKYGIETAKEVQKEMDENRFSSLGKIHLIRQKIQAMKDVYSNAASTHERQPAETPFE